MLKVFTLDDPPPDPLGWIVDGIIPAHGLTTVAGPPGVGKSVLTASLAVSVASGVDWLDLPVDHGGVLFIAGEAAGSTRRRLAAMVAALPSPPPVAVAAGSINLTDDSAAAAITAAVREASKRLGEPIRLLIADALGSLTRGTDENRAADMSRATGTLLEVIEECGVAVVLLAHTAKSGDDQRVRGHSGLLADVDTHIGVKGAGAVKTMTVLKMRDAEAGRSISFRIVADGDLLTVQPADRGAASKPRPLRVSGDVAHMLHVIAEFGRPVSFEAVRKVCGERFAVRPDGTRRSPSAVRTAISYARSSLSERGLIEDDGSTVSVRETSETVRFISDADAGGASEKKRQNTPFGKGGLTFSDAPAAAVRKGLLS
jgi:KaiC/GvpD/RAD55 family RecA-like ATPase